MEKEMPWWKEPTRGQWFSFGAAWFGWVLDAFDFTIFLLVMPAIAKHFGVSATATALTVTLTLLTRLLGSFVAGAAADRWGRKLPLLISIVWFALCDGAIAFAPTFGWVIALRILFGFGMGAEWTAGTTLAMENWPVRSRGIASGILQGSWAIGYLIAAVVARYVSDWRTLFIIAALPALAVLPMRIWVPESEEVKKATKERGAKLRDLLGKGIVRRLVWASGTLSLGLAAYYAFVSTYSFLLEKELKFDHPYAMSVIAVFNIGMLLGSILCGTLAKRRGVVAAVVGPSLLMLPIIPLYVGVFPSLTIVGALLAGIIGVGWCGIVPMYLTGLFPAHVRAKAVGICYHVGAVFAALVPPATTELAKLLAPHTSSPWAWAIGLMIGTFEVLLVILLLKQPKDITGTQSESAPAEDAPAQAIGASATEAA